MKVRWSKASDDIYDLKLKHARVRYSWLWTTFVAILATHWVDWWWLLYVESTTLVSATGYTVYAIHLREKAPLASVEVRTSQSSDR